MSESIITAESNKLNASKEYRRRPFEIHHRERLVISIPKEIQRKYCILAGCSEIVIIDTGNELRLRIETRRSILGA